MRLKNIVLNGNLLSTEYFPEDDKAGGSIVIDVNTKAVVEKKLSKRDEVIAIYYRHALTALIEMVGKEIPKEKLVMWC